MKNKDNFSILTEEIKTNEELTSFQKILYSEIISLTKKDWFCWASNKHFAEKFKKSASYISKSITKFWELWLLKIFIDKEIWNIRKIYIWKTKNVSWKVSITQVKELWDCSDIAIAEEWQSYSTEVTAPIALEWHIIYKWIKKNKKNNTNVLLWTEAQKTSDLINFSENEKIENSNDELETEELEKESDKNSALAENPVYWKAEINDTLDFLKKIIWVSDFKESQKMQRIFGKHILNLWQKIWKEDFVFRLKNILKDSFKAKNCNSLKYLYAELKAFIHSPLVEVEPEKTKRKVTFW